MADHVAGLDARLVGRGAVDGRDDLDETVLLRHLDADAAELALGLDLHRGKVLGVHIAGMRVQRGQHAANRRLDQLLAVGGFDILRADAFKHVAEQIQLFIDRFVLGRLLRDQGAGNLRRQHSACDNAAKCGQNHLLHPSSVLGLLSHNLVASGLTE